MIARYFYQEDIATFLAEDIDTIFGKMARADEMNTADTQKLAWEQEIAIMKDVLQPYANEPGQIIFEYTIPRMGKRIDVVVLLRERIFVIEFKVGETEIYREDINQVMGYALDLKYYHLVSQDRIIIPILVSTDSPDFAVQLLPRYSDGVYSLYTANTNNFAEVIRIILADEIPDVEYHFSIEDWARSRYTPSPTIIEAARALYLNQSVKNITKSEAEGAQLEKTTRFVQQVIHNTKANKGIRGKNKSICFVTGVPGAGKTLVGLNVAVQQENEDLAVYLSGNGPLVEVLTESLTRDKQRQERENGNKITKKEAEQKVKRFIQIIHRYRDNMLNKTKVVDRHLEIDPTKELRDERAGYGEVENIAIFDEAQRSWDKEHIAAWLKRKKGFENFPMSEGEFLIWSLDQREDWAVIICLVGGGQEINTGEAGIGEWIRALNDTFPDWNVYISPQLSAKEYAEGRVSELLLKNSKVTYSDDLHLSVCERSPRALHLSDMVHALLDGDIEKAASLYNKIVDLSREYNNNGFHIKLTRDLEKAKKWLLENTRTDEERYGMLVSSKAYRLKPLAIDVRCKPDTVHWFLDDKDDVRSSLFLEDAATEFDVQGLELDRTCIIWDGDLRRENGTWNFFEFNGGKRWNLIKKPERQAYLINAYRVLLTRARHGMVICVPKGDPNDATRLPEFYNGTYEYLKSLGIEEI